MKTIKSITAVAVSTLLFGNLLFAQGTINQRERHQQKRIADGVHDGELTAKGSQKAREGASQDPFGRSEIQS
jgi:hypothetical protein